MRPDLSLLLSALAFASPAFARQEAEPAPTIEQVVARVIAAALPDARYSWALEWSAFGGRVGRDLFWHLAPPVPYQPVPLPPGVHQRTGWLSARGASGDVEVCGDAERVGALSMEIPDIWLGRSDLAQELEARGVTVKLVESREAVPPPRGSDDGRSDSHYRALLARYPVYRHWRLERSGFRSATLTATHLCTPPGTRSAT